MAVQVYEGDGVDRRQPPPDVLELCRQALRDQKEPAALAMLECWRSLPRRKAETLVITLGWCAQAEVPLSMRREALLAMSRMVRDEHLRG